MSIVKTQAVVLRYADFKEADRMLTLFSPELGKIQAVARGCRKPRSRLLSAAQLLCYGDFMLYKTRNLFILSQAEVKDSFFDIRNDVEKFAYAVYILNLTEEAVNLEEGNYRLFHLLLHILTYLAYDDFNPEDLLHIFEIKLLDILGYRPQLGYCVRCSTSLKMPLHFSTQEGGLVCHQCYNRSNNGYTIQMGTVQTFKHVLNMDLKRLKVIGFTPTVRKELDTILSRYLEERMEKSFKSRSFIDQLKKANPKFGL